MRTGLLGWYGPDHRPWVDSLLLLGILVLTAEEGLFQWLHADGPLRPYRIVVAALSALSLLFARRHPAASAVLPVLTSSLFNRAFPGLFSVAHLASLGRTGPAVAAGAVIVLVRAARADSLVGWAGATGSQLLLQVAVLSFGLWLHGRRALIRALHAQVENLRRERELRAEQARSAERARIAREMHDVVAHRVSLMVVHAGALERIAVKDPEKAAQSAKLMGEVGRQALNELREILGVLRMDDERQPEPDSLAGLPRLVDQSRAAGMAVTLTVSGSRQDFTGDAEQTAYRVVQEGLTNAHKHAGGAQVSVLLAYAPNGVRVSVVNACPGGERGAAQLPSGGNGLVGMRERVIALGGTFSSGPEADGGFRVEAVLPSRLAVRSDRLG